MNIDCFLISLLWFYMVLYSDHIEDDSFVWHSALKPLLRYFHVVNCSSARQGNAFNEVPPRVTNCLPVYLIEIG